jgi:hypothetical protein
LQGRAGGSWRWGQRQQRQRRRTERGATARGRQRGPPRRGRARRGRGCCCCRSNTGRRQRSAVAVRSSLSSRLKQSQFNWLLAPVALRHSVHVNVGGRRHGAVGLAQCGRRRTCATYEYCAEGDKARDNGDDSGDGGGQMACLPWQCKQTCIVHLSARLVRCQPRPPPGHGEDASNPSVIVCSPDLDSAFLRGRSVVRANHQILHLPIQQLDPTHRRRKHNVLLRILENP